MLIVQNLYAPLLLNSSYCVSRRRYLRLGRQGSPRREVGQERKRDPGEMSGARESRRKKGKRGLEEAWWTRESYSSSSCLNCQSKKKHREQSNKNRDIERVLEKFHIQYIAHKAPGKLKVLIKIYVKYS